MMGKSATLPVIKKTAIHNVRVFDGQNLTEPRHIFIEEGVIRDEIEEPEEIIDGRGGILLPGFIDSHVHLQDEGHLRELARYGVTTALDMASWPAAKINGLRDKPGVCDIRSAGLPATCAGSIHSHMLPLPREALLSDAGQARSFVEERISEGSDYIKMIADVPGPSQEVLNALAACAHGHGRMVVAHASSYTPFRMALEARADIITHAPRDKAVSADMVQQMAENKLASCPTLVMMQEVSTKRPSLGAIFNMLFKPALLVAVFRAKRSGENEDKYENARDSVASLHKGGVTILAGTDCHEEPNSFVDVKHGESLHRELELLVKAGLSTVDALRAATILPAQSFGLLDRGVIAEGKRADLVLLRDNPIQDIAASRSIERVWCHGIEVTDVTRDNSRCD